MFKRHTILMLILLTVSTSVTAQPTTAPTGADEQVITRVYEITDLQLQKRDYPAHNESRPDSNGGQNLFGAPPTTQPSASDLAGSLVSLIQDTVATDTWRDNGGTIGNIRQLNGILIVTQTSENHRLIADLLQQLRQNHGRMVVVQAFWVLADPDSPLLAPAQPDYMKLVDEKLLDAKHLYCQARTTCFSGQTVHVTSGRKRTIVTDVTPIVGSDSVGLDPTVGTAPTGVSLQVMALLEPEGPESRAVLDLQSTVSESTVEGKVDLPTTKPTLVNESIDRVNEMSQELRTTVRLPLGRKVLVGGMTLEPASKEDPARQLYLVIEADAVK
jgi:hypothetical protein